VFPGSNCDADMRDALQEDLGQEVIMLWHKDRDLSAFSKTDCIVLPGGFSYGDYLRCGAIARFSPMMQSVVAFAQQGGKVFGVCNGFQILCESHLFTEEGVVTDAANPNGSTLNIAGICNENRNVFGMMPHPERACSAALNNTDGRAIFEQLLMAGELVK